MAGGDNEGEVEEFEVIVDGSDVSIIAIWGAQPSDGFHRQAD
jgi:hypothetical protein